MGKIVIKYIHADDKISFGGVSNKVKLVDKDGGFLILDVSVEDKGFVYDDNLVDDIGRYKYCKFVMNGMLQSVDMLNDAVISLPDKVEPVKRERKIDFEEEQASYTSKVVVEEEDREKFSEVFESVMEGAKTHRLFKVLDASEELVDNTLEKVCFTLDYDDYGDVYRSIELLRGQAPELVDNKFQVCYKDFQSSLNVLNNAVPYNLGTNPMDVMMNNDEVYEYDFGKPRCKDLAKSDFLDNAVKTSKKMDMADFKNRANIKVPTWKILFLSVMIGGLNFVASIIRNVPVVGCKIAKIFKRQANMLSDRIRGYTTIDLGIGTIDLGSNDQTGNTISGCSGDANLPSYDPNVNDEDIENNLNEMEEGMSVDLSNCASCLSAAQKVMEVYKNKMIENKPEKVAGLLFKTKVKTMRNALSIGVIKDLEKYIPGVGAVLLNDITNDSVNRFYWKPVIEKMIEDNQKFEE